MSNMLGIDAMTQAQGQEAAATEAAGSAKLAAGLQYWKEAQTREDIVPWLTAGKETLSALWSGIQEGYGLEEKRVPMSEEEYIPTLQGMAERARYQRQRARGKTFEELVPESQRMKTTYVSPTGLGGLSFEKYEKSPYYNFLLEEGTKSLERGAASKGMLQSGAEKKALVEHGEKFASTDYRNWEKAWYQSLTPLQSLAGLGQTTGTQLGALGAQSAQAQGNALMTAGAYNAAGTLGQANTMANTMGYQSNMLSPLLQSGINSLFTPSGMGNMGAAGNVGLGNILSLYF